MIKTTQADSPYLIGWKAIARYLGVHWQTARRWHYTICRLPFYKSAPSQQGRVMTTKVHVMICVKFLGRQFPKEILKKS
ncbi:MAG: hypothetical protein IPJ69_00840 [Deltaproteobacteria bacterium]|nr:MAG: hypothetical protein IPJ69_00840 [Deltaproteobacteria bacterium]